MSEDRDGKLKMAADIFVNVVCKLEKCSLVMWRESQTTESAPRVDLITFNNDGRKKNEQFEDLLVE